MGRSMAHIAHQPGPVCLEGGVRRWLVRVVVLGGGAAPAPPTRGAWGASSIRVPKKNARCPGRPGLPRKAWSGWLSLLRCSREGRQGEQSRCFHNLHALSNVHEENLSCARDQVVIARPPVLTPPWRSRHSLMTTAHRTGGPPRRKCVWIDFGLGAFGRAASRAFRGL
jgi:hypothetical protein